MNVLQLFDFWTMLMVIVLLSMGLVALWVLAGPTGRFLILANATGSNLLGLIQTVDNRIKFHRIKSEGRNVIVNNKRHMFQVDQVRASPTEKFYRVDVQDGQIVLKEDQQTPVTTEVNPYHFNEAIKKPVYLDNKVVLLGHEASGVMVNPNTIKQISNAQWKGSLEEQGVFVPYSLADIYELLKIVLTPQRAESIYQAGVNRGRAARELREQVLLGVIVVLTIGLVVMGYLLVR
jgi:hypothetical protein